MTDAERLAERLLDLVSNFTKPSYRNTLNEAAALIRSQAEELERLREFVRYIEETSDDEHEVRKARAALGER